MTVTNDREIENMLAKNRMWTLERLIHVNPTNQDKGLTELEAFPVMPMEKNPFGKLYFSEGTIQERERKDRNERALKKRRLEQDFLSGPAIDTLVCNLGLDRISV